MKVEFGRANRGHNWHVVRPGSVTGSRALCRPLQLVNVTEGQPPRQAVVCPVCARDVADLARAVELAMKPTT